MSATEPLARRLRTIALVWVDALAYAAVVAAVTTLAALVVGIATGGGFVRAKFLLFLAGFVLLAYATVRLWPSSPEDVERSDPAGAAIGKAATRTRFQSFVRALPPVRWLPAPPPRRRMTTAGKLLLSSLAVLLVSFLMEAVFGIAAPPHAG